MLLFSNPIAGPLAQRFLGGIGFRIYYLYPLAFCFGLLVSQIGPLLRSMRTAAWLALLAAAAGATLYGRWIPASMAAGAETVLLTGFAAAILLAAGGLWWQHGRPWEPVLRCVVLSLFGCLFTVQSQRFTFSAANGATFKRPGDYRFSGPVREFDRLTASYLDHRTVLAPREIALAAAVTQLSCRFVVTFDSYTNWSFAVENRLPEAKQRALAQTVVGAGNMSPGALAAFRAALAQGVDAVITAPPANIPKVESLLAESGSRWECRVAAGGYRLLLRQTSNEPNTSPQRKQGTLARSASEEQGGFPPSLALRASVAP
jgi:alkylhydroperoxidase family enzyme